MNIKRNLVFSIAVFSFFILFSTTHAKISSQNQVQFDKPDDKNYGSYCIIVKSLGTVSENSFNTYQEAEDYANVSSLDPGVKDITFLVGDCSSADSVKSKTSDTTTSEKKTVDKKVVDEKIGTSTSSKEGQMHIMEKNSGCTLDPGQAYTHSNTNAVWLITGSGTKRPFQSSRIFKTHFDSFDQVKVTTEENIMSCSDDKAGFVPYGPKYDPKGGALVKIPSDKKVYLLLDGKKHWINSETVFNELNYKWNWIQDVDKKLLNKYQTAGEINDTNKHPVGSLIKYPDSSNVYRIEKDDSGELIKRHIANESVFNKLGFRFDRVVEVDSSEEYPTGDSIE